MTARCPGRPAAASSAPRVLDEAGETVGTCLACGRRYGLDDMIGHAGRHMRAAPGAGAGGGGGGGGGGGAGRSYLLLLTGGGPAAGGAWVLAQVWDRCTLDDLAEFIECEWFGRRMGVRAAIAGTTGTALLDMTASVSELFTKAAELKLETDTEYRILVQRVGEAPCRPAAGSAASVLAESPIVPDISFKELDGRGPHAAPAAPPAPAHGEGAEPGGPPGRAPPGRSVPAPARPGGWSFHAGLCAAPSHGGRSP